MFLLIGTLSATARTPIFVLIILLIVGVFFLISIPLGIIVTLDMCALVLDREGVFGSFGSGYDLFRRNLGRSLLVWLVGFTLSLGVGLALLIAA